MVKVLEHFRREKVFKGECVCKVDDTKHSEAVMKLQRHDGTSMSHLPLPFQETPTVTHTLILSLSRGKACIKFLFPMSKCKML